MERRDFLKMAGAVALGTQAAPLQLHNLAGAASAAQQHAAAAAANGAADVTLRIAPVLVELAPNQTVSTIGYNGLAPGPILRMREGVRTTVDVFNDTDVPELVHWHGQMIPPEVDGVAEEGTPAVPAHGHRRYSFVPRPAGTRWYHSHVMAGPDLSRGIYTGQFGFLYVDPKSEPGNYDREIFLALREWQPYLTAEEDEEEDEGDKGVRKDAPPPSKKSKANMIMPTGLEVGYRLMSINDKTLGNGEPIRVKQGERILFRMLNASPTEPRRVSLPGHKFLVVALDGNPVPTPKAVEILQMGPAERIDAIVEMNQPGVWVLGSILPEDRQAGMGVVVEYANQTGEPKTIDRPPLELWDYTQFGTSKLPPEPDGRFTLTIEEIHGGPGRFNRWVINGKSFPNTDPLKVRAGKRYRIIIRNRSDDPHPMHLHRHQMELTSMDHQPTAGVIKDTITVLGFGDAEMDFVANQPGPALFHCHMQIHMDFGLMCMVKYI
jgi:FtsP/CotA-like multicopper oxidase with cupredoxin domain